MADRPSPHELWVQAGEDGERYRELLREHGHILRPGDEGYEQGSRTLPCGWPGPQKPAAEWCIHEMPPGTCSVCTGRGEEVPDRSPSSPGPWITARYGGSCVECGTDIAPGDQIRSAGTNRWLCAECGGES